MKLLLLAMITQQIVSSVDVYEPSFDAYQQIVKQRMTTEFIMKDRLRVIDNQLLHIDKLLHSKDCPSFLFLANETLHQDRKLIKYTLNHFEDLSEDIQ